jgi:hypothetical protein
MMAEDKTLAKESIFSTPFSIHRPRTNVPYYHLTQPVLGASFTVEEEEEHPKETVLPEKVVEEAVDDEDDEDDEDDDEDDDDDNDDNDVPRCLRNDPMFLYGGFAKVGPNQLPFNTMNAFPAFLSEDAEIPDCLRSIFVGIP